MVVDKRILQRQHLARVINPLDPRELGLARAVSWGRTDDPLTPPPVDRVGQFLSPATGPYAAALIPHRTAGARVGAEPARIPGRLAEMGPAHPVRIVSRRTGNRRSPVAEQPQHAALADLQSFLEIGIGTGLIVMRRIVLGGIGSASEMDGGMVGRIGAADRSVLAADLQGAATKDGDVVDV